MKLYRVTGSDGSMRFLVACTMLEAEAKFEVDGAEAALVEEML